MDKQTQLQRNLYGYIGFAFFCVFLNIVNVFRPVPDILAAITLLIACFHIGKYGTIDTKKK